MTILRLSSPAVWESPTTLRVGGADRSVSFDDAPNAVERLISDLEIGIDDRELARRETAGVFGGLDLHQVLTALEWHLEPLAVDRQRSAARARETSGGEPERLVVAARGDDWLLDGLRRALVTVAEYVTFESVRDLAEFTTESAAASDAVAPSRMLVVEQSRYVYAPRRFQPWMERDTPHLAIRSDVDRVEVSPILRPGLTPCTMCQELDRIDADAAWMVVAPQLQMARVPSHSKFVRGRVVAHSMVRILDWMETASGSLPASDSARGASEAETSATIVAADGTTWPRQWHAHPRCTCQGFRESASEAEPHLERSLVRPTTG